MIDCYTRYITVGMSIDKMWQLGITSKAMMGVGGGDGLVHLSQQSTFPFQGDHSSLPYHQKALEAFC
jgi:hypothetical protein